MREKYCTRGKSLIDCSVGLFQGASHAESISVHRLRNRVHRGRLCAAAPYARWFSQRETAKRSRSIHTHWAPLPEVPLRASAHGCAQGLAAPESRGLTPVPRFTMMCADRNPQFPSVAARIWAVCGAMQERKLANTRNPKSEVFRSSARVADHRVTVRSWRS